MSARRLVLASALLLGGASACQKAADDPAVGAQESVEVEIECVGMGVYDVLGFDGASTQTRSASADGSSDPRCVFMVASKRGIDVPPVMGTDFANQVTNNGSNWSALRFQYAGASWVAYSGGLHFDADEHGKASGTFDVMATPDSTRKGHFTGKFDWCEYGARADCPHANVDDLDQSVTIEAPGFSGKGKTNACRILVDPKTQGMQVDMQLASWNGVNVAQYRTQECGVFGTVFDPKPNSFVFRASGVSGPGSYGPVPSLSSGGRRLPELSWTTPLVFAPSSAGVACPSIFYEAVAKLDENDGSTCSFTIKKNPGKFEVTCSKVRQAGPPSASLPLNATGDFHLVTDCEYKQRP